MLILQSLPSNIDKSVKLSSTNSKFLIHENEYYSSIKIFIILQINYGQPTTKTFLRTRGHSYEKLFREKKRTPYKKADL